MKTNTLPQTKPFARALGAVIVTSLLVVTGCVVTSVYPFYTAKDIVKDAALVGTWVNADPTQEDRQTWQFEPALAQSYRLTVRAEDKTNAYTTHLFRLRDARFLDALPVERLDDSIPPHYLLKVTRTEPQLELTLMDYDWLKKLVRDDPKAIRHLWLDKPPGQSGDPDLVLTADTAELQALLLKYANDTNVFANTIKLKRR